MLWINFCYMYPVAYSLSKIKQIKNIKVLLTAVYFRHITWSSLGWSMAGCVIRIKSWPITVMGCKSNKHTDVMRFVQICKIWSVSYSIFILVRFCRQKCFLYLKKKQNKVWLSQRLSYHMDIYWTFFAANWTCCSHIRDLLLLIEAHFFRRIPSCAQKSTWVHIGIITMTSYWTRWRLKSLASRLLTQPFIQTQIKENIKAPRHWPLCGEFTETGEFPAQRASCAENVSIWWRHHDGVITKKLTPLIPRREYSGRHTRVLTMAAHCIVSGDFY